VQEDQPGEHVQGVSGTRYPQFVEQGDLVFTVDLDGNFTSINAAAERLSGYTREEALKLNLADVVAPEYLDFVREMLGAKLRGDLEQTRYPVAILTKDGRRVELEVSTWVGARDSRSVEIRGLAHDPTELQRQLALALEARAQAEAALRDRDEMLSSCAHELRTPLTTIQAYVELIRDAATGREDAHAMRSLAAIERQCVRLLRLIEELLENAGLEFGRLTLYRRLLDLGELTASVVADLAAANPAHRMRLDVQGTTWVDADGYRIEQVLLNLLSNAVKFSPEGSEITVQVVPEGDTVRVSIRDQGIGIRAEQQARLFERFYRAHAGTPYDRPGLGLGLYISRELVLRHGGQMWCESVEGEGATFAFRLPLAVETRGQGGP
jgi:PAS domain S-box-containing protein